MANKKNKSPSVLSVILSGVGGLGIVAILAERVSKHEEVDSSLSEVIDIIGNGDSVIASNEVEEGFLLSRITRKIEFIRQVQNERHRDKMDVGQRFSDISGLSSFSTVQSATRFFHSVEKGSHPDYSTLLKSAKWKVAMRYKGKESPRAQTTVSHLPSEVATALGVAVPSSSSQVKGLFLKSLPDSLKGGQYPVIDLKSPSSVEALKGLPQNTIPSERYFVPAPLVQSAESPHAP